MDESRLTDEQILAQFHAAVEADAAADRTEPRAREVRYDPRSGRIVVELRTGGAFAFLPALYPELAGRTPDELALVQPSPSGEGLSWDALDVHLETAGVLVRMLGPSMVRAFATRGGRSTSDRKAAAARENGRRGGRPRGSGYRPAPGFGNLAVREEKRATEPPPEDPGTPERGR